MAEQWIPSRQARELVRDTSAICTRLHEGLIRSRARFLQMGDKRGENVLVPKEFWWAQGYEALTAHWQAGDFSTWIDKRIECKAFGVEIGLAGLAEMLPFEQRAALIRSLSVANNPEWVTANAARQLFYSEFGLNPAAAGSGLIAQARLGFVSARAVLAQGSSGERLAPEWSWEEREWDIPAWFWTDFTQANSSAQEWEQGRFSGRGSSPRGYEAITLSGVYFLRSTLGLAAPSDAADPPPPQGKRGRRPEYDWEAAVNAVWGQIYRGVIDPGNQAQLEKVLIGLLTKGDKEPSESTVRPHAAQIWAEKSKA